MITISGRRTVFLSQVFPFYLQNQCLYRLWTQTDSHFTQWGQDIDTVIHFTEKNYCYTYQNQTFRRPDQRLSLVFCVCFCMLLYVIVIQLKSIPQFVDYLVDHLVYTKTLNNSPSLFICDRQLLSIIAVNSKCEYIVHVILVCLFSLVCFFKT